MVVIEAKVEGRIERFVLAEADAINMPVTLGMLTKQPPFLVRVKDVNNQLAVISTETILSAKER